ncbi:MAG: hypothetical protein JST30_11010 [Armatimonadetes bacterium]|nr:hypothetical protein [Armatimonadota bacterium]
MKLPSFCGTLGLAALAVVSHAQLDKTVSFSAPAMEPKKALAELSKVAGLELDAASDFVDEPLYLSVTDVTVKDLLDRIATVLHGKWTDTRNGKRLERDKDDVRAMELAQAQRRVHGYEEAVKTFLDKRADDGKWTSEHVAKLIEKERKERNDILANVRANNPDIGNGTINIMKGSSSTVTPATPALLEALRKLPASVLASVGPGQRLVYATTPTNVQKRLPFSANNLIDTFVRSHETLVRALSGPNVDPPNVSVRGGLDLSAKPLQGSVQEVLLVLTRRGNFEGVNVELKIADGSGTYVGTASAWIAPKTEAKTAADSGLKPDGTIDLSALGKELAVNFVTTSGDDGGNQSSFAISTSGSGGAVFRIASDSPTATPVLSREALAALADPVRTDPQGTFVSEALSALSKQSGLDIVAALPDTVIMPIAKALAKGGKVADLFPALNTGKASMTHEGDWAVLTADDWLVSRTSQMRRASAKTLYGAVVSKGYARLQELSRFAASLGTVPDSTNFGIVTLRAIEPFVAEDLQFPMDQNPGLYQLLGTLDRQVFDNPKPETVFRIGTMSQAQIAMLERTVYGQSTGGSIFGEGDFIGIGISTGEGDRPQEPPADGLHNEPTEAYPQGLPAMGEFRLKFTPMDSVYASIKGTRGGRFMTAEGLAQMEALSENDRIPDLQSKMLKFDQFRPSLTTLVESHLTFGNKSVHRGDFSDVLLPENTKSGAFNDLPQKFREAVAASKAQMREGIAIGGRGPKKPPL